MVIVTVPGRARGAARYTDAMTSPDPGAASGGIAIDPVCGMEVEVATARHTTEYHGATYYFCGKGCRLDFEDDPEKYLDPDYVPSM